MIDDYNQAMALMDKMKSHLPIPARPDSALLKLLAGKKLKITRGQVLPIKKVLYSGDEGGIICDVTSPGQEETPLVVSLTHLRVKSDHPLTGEIRAYQLQRKGRLAGAEGTSTLVTIKGQDKEE